MLLNTAGEEVKVRAMGLDEVNQIPQVGDLTGIHQSFTELPSEESVNPTGWVDLLMGLDYASYLPRVEKVHGHLLLLESQFGSGRLVAGRLEEEEDQAYECPSARSQDSGDGIKASEKDRLAPKGVMV